MPERFFGTWTVEVTHKDANFSQRFVVSGSDSSDGVYPGVTGSGPIAISGDEWTVTLEWNDNASSDWQPSGVRRLASYTLHDGLVIVLGADDNLEHLRDGDFDDVVLTCTSLDPTINPFRGFVNPYDFTVSKDVMRRYERDRRRRPTPRLRRPREPRPPDR